MTIQHPRSSEMWSNYPPLRPKHCVLTATPLWLQRSRMLWALLFGLCVQSPPWSGKHNKLSTTNLCTLKVLIHRPQMVYTTTLFFLYSCLAGCCLLPFCLDNFKDVKHTCPKCHSLLHIVTKLWWLYCNYRQDIQLENWQTPLWKTVLTFVLTFSTIQLIEKNLFLTCVADFYTSWQFGSPCHWYYRQVGMCDKLGYCFPS